jgi:hypothetical protein
MRTISSCAAVASLFVVFAACGPKQPDASQQPAMAPTGTAPYGYPQQPGAYPQQPGAYPQPTATYAQPPGAPAGYPPAPAPTAAPPAAGGQMATPGPLAFQCSNDVPCGLNHCNMQFSKCAFPCQSVADCITPNVCGPVGFCVPASMQPTPAH